MKLVIIENIFVIKIMKFAGINGAKTFFSNKLDSLVKKSDDAYCEERKICGMMWLFDDAHFPVKYGIAGKMGGNGTREEYHKMLKRVCTKGDLDEFEETIMKDFLHGPFRSINKKSILTITNVVDYNEKRKKNMIYSIFRVSFPEEEEANDILIIDTIDGVSDNDYENVNIGYMLDSGEIWSCLE